VANFIERGWNEEMFIKVMRWSYRRTAAKLTAKNTTEAN
jgi:hypothetical protein